MAEQQQKPKTITFEPDEDVAKVLSDLLRDLGQPWGMRSKVINDVLRDGLPEWRSQMLQALRGKKAA